MTAGSVARGPAWLGQDWAAALPAQPSSGPQRGLEALWRSTGNTVLTLCRPGNLPAPGHWDLLSVTLTPCTQSSWPQTRCSCCRWWAGLSVRPASGSWPLVFRLSIKLLPHKAAPDLLSQLLVALPSCTSPAQSAGALHWNLELREGEKLPPAQQPQPCSPPGPLHPVGHCGCLHWGSLQGQPNPSAASWSFSSLQGCSGLH